MAGQDYWATPGSGVEDGETFEQAASRELGEETGMRAESAGREVGQRTFVLQLPSGEHVVAGEHCLLVHAATGTVSRDAWRAAKAEVMADHRWWFLDDLARTGDTVWPDNLVALLEQAEAVQES